MILELKQARDLIVRCGWSGPGSEPWCLDVGGRRCWEHDEGVAAFSVEGALRAVAAGGFPETLDALEAVVAPAHEAYRQFHCDPEKLTPQRWRVFQGICRSSLAEVPLDKWLQEPRRTKDDVLSLFVGAIKRSKKATGERR